MRYATDIIETLCAALAQSMISDYRPVSIKFEGKGELLEMWARYLRIVRELG